MGIGCPAGCVCGNCYVKRREQAIRDACPDLAIKIAMILEQRGDEITISRKMMQEIHDALLIGASAKRLVEAFNRDLGIGVGD